MKKWWWFVIGGVVVVGLIVMSVIRATSSKVESVQLASVRRILADNGMAEQARLVVANKLDAADDPALVRELVEREAALPVSARTREGLGELMAEVERAVQVVRSRPPPPVEPETSWVP